MCLVSNPELSYIPWAAVLCGHFEGKAFLCGFAEAAPRPRLHLFALGVTLLPSATQVGQGMHNLLAGFTPQ